MELFDGILYLLYLVITVAVAVVVWSYVLRRLRSTGRGAVQNGIHIRVINAMVWLFVALVVLVVALCCRGDIASIMLLTLTTVLLATCLTIGWSMITKR